MKANNFNLEKFIKDIFAPVEGEKITIMIDIPTGRIPDNTEWKERRTMADEWHKEILKFSQKLKLVVNPLATYNATGSNNSDLPKKCFIGQKEADIESVINNSTIIVSMPTYSATAPLYEYSLKRKDLRVASMPGVQRFMEETGLSADYSEIKERCKVLEKIFSDSKGANVIFSTGHRCYFDIGLNTPMIDNGILHPEMGGTEYSLSNLPAGEVYVVPNEKVYSKTRGELPLIFNDELVILEVNQNRVINVSGEGRSAKILENEFMKDDARRNIAEFAVGVNDMATVTGNVLQDEKAGFHWAYGRSDHLGGSVGVNNFNNPNNVVHQDYVYAKGNKIECIELVLFLKDGTEKKIIDGSELFV